jgi:fumarate reductase subunit C
MTGAPYLRPFPAWWWLRRRRYLSYMARELSSLFIGAYAALLLLGVLRLAEGRAAYEAFLAALASPAAVTFHVVVLVAALIHTTSWFGLAPKAVPARIGGARVAPAAVVAGHYAVWALISLGALVLVGL